MSKRIIVCGAALTGALLASLAALSCPYNGDGVDGIADRHQGRGKPATGVVRSPGKRGAPVELGWHVGSKPGLGSPVQIDLNLLATAAIDGITLQVMPGPGLAAVAGHGEVVLKSASAGDRLDHGVVIVPDREGTLYLHVVALVDTPYGRQVRTFAVPLVVGDPGAGARDKTAGRLESGPDGERVVVMPVRESDDR